MPKAYPINILPPREYLLARFIYEPATGALIWRTGRFAGKIAGWANAEGYRCIGLDGTTHYAHRVIFKMMTGEEPPATLDHRDNAPGDNRWEQIRPATVAEQNWNTRQKKLDDGRRRGVYRTRNKFIVRFGGKDARRHIGTFDTIEEANAAAEAAQRELSGEFFNHS